MVKLQSKCNSCRNEKIKYGAEWNLSLREPQRGGELGALREGEVLRFLEIGIELLQLEGRVNGARLPGLLGFPVSLELLFVLAQLSLAKL